MNLFYNYQEKIFNSLKILDKRKIIHIPRKLKSFTVELPPKNQKADISCNAAMILAKVNNNSPIKLAEILKKHLLLKTGYVSALFLIFYSIARIIGENFREPDVHLGYFFNYFSMGVMLSFATFLAGCFIIFFIRNNEQNN